MTVTKNILLAFLFVLTTSGYVRAQVSPVQTGHYAAAFGYYYPTEDQATAITLGLTYEINGEIKDAGLRYGIDFDAVQRFKSNIPGLNIIHAREF